MELRSIIGVHAENISLKWKSFSLLAKFPRPSKGWCNGGSEGLHLCSGSQSRIPSNVSAFPSSWPSPSAIMPTPSHSHPKTEGFSPGPLGCRKHTPSPQPQAPVEAREAPISGTHLGALWAPLPPPHPRLQGSGAQVSSVLPLQLAAEKPVLQKEGLVNMSHKAASKYV